MYKIEQYVYSQKEAHVPEYRFRGIFEVSLSSGDHRVDIYTDNPSKEDFEKKVVERVKNKLGLEVKMIHCATKESDDSDRDIIDTL
jgi:hypothetical protein